MPIQDKRLRKFYEHLDHINQGLVSPFQTMQRYRKLLTTNVQPRSKDGPALPLELRMMPSDPL